jgi:hypothetical protein
MAKTGRPRPSIAIATLLLGAWGCSSPADERVLEISQQSLARQAEQNQQMARQSQEVAEAARQLVEADAQAKQEMIQAHAELQEGLESQRASLGAEENEIRRQHTALESERKQLAEQRHRDPLIAAAIVQIGAVLGCLLPVVLCFVVLRALRQEPVDANPDLSDFLIEELVAEQPLLEFQQPPSLPLESPAPPALPPVQPSD